MKVDGNTYKTYLNSKLFSELRCSNSLDSLAYFLYLSHKFPHKTFTKDRALLFVNSEHTFDRHFRRLKALGLISKKNGWYILASNAEIEKIYGGKSKLYTAVDTLKGFKDFLSVIPVISNIHRQNKIIGKKGDFRRIHDIIESGRFYNMRSGKYKAYQNATKKGMSFKSDNLKLSIKGIMRLANCSEKTAVILKSRISDLGIATFKRIKEKQKVSDLGHFNFLKSEGLIPSYSVFHNGYAYWDKSTEIILKSNYYGFSSFSSSNDSLLMS